jgi:pimeloyl-ACP methyl ester carboxylesterase
MAQVELEGKQGSLAASLVHPSTRQSEIDYDSPVVVASAGFIPGAAPSEGASRLEELAERLAAITGWSALTFSPSGVGRSDGRFSPEAWKDDWEVAVGRGAEFANGDPIVLLGFGLIGTVARAILRGNDRVRGLVTVSMDLGLEDEVVAGELLRQMKVTGTVIDSTIDVSSLRESFHRLRMLDPMPNDDRPWLVIQAQSQRDRLLEELADCSVAELEIHLFETDPESIRYDPRTLAVFMGWMDRCF